MAQIVSEAGVQFAKPEAVELFRQAGQAVDGGVVRLDPEFVPGQVAKAPRESGVQARNPANNVHIGGGQMVFGGVYGSPFVREGDVRRGPRRPASAAWPCWRRVSPSPIRPAG